MRQASTALLLARLKPERVIAIVAAAGAVGLFAAIPGAVSGYRLGVSASDWETAWGRIEQRQHVRLPYLMCFVPDVRYSLIEYSYEPTGQSRFAGYAQAPIRSDVYPGATIEIRFNPKNPSQSLPAMSVADYRSAHGASLLLAPLLGLAFSWVARRLWRTGLHSPAER